ncbi:MAG: hypothetical protein WEB06_17595 [Actinomycetota bacterium]
MIGGEAIRAGIEAITEMTLVSVPTSQLRDLFTIGSIASVALRDLLTG